MGLFNYPKLFIVNAANCSLLPRSCHPERSEGSGPVKSHGMEFLNNHWLWYFPCALFKATNHSNNAMTQSPPARSFAALRMTILGGGNSLREGSGPVKSHLVVFFYNHWSQYGSFGIGATRLCYNGPTQSPPARSFAALRMTSLWGTFAALRMTSLGKNSLSSG